MNAREYLSDDGQAMLALCSAFALKEDSEGSRASPFTLSEWNQLARQIHKSSFQRPGELQGRSAADIARELAIAADESERITRLLDRSGRLALELENLYSRGMWVLTRMDEQYPSKLRDTLRHQAPTVIFGAGEVHLLGRPGIAVVGSRNIDESGATFAREIGRKTSAAKQPVVSGGARGSDRLAMDGSLGAGGTAVGALADSLEATIRKPDVRDFLLEGRLALLTPYSPSAGFSVGAAMGRNKVIYGLAGFAVVVSSDFKTGGTWTGAAEALKAGWCPVFVRDGANVPKGNLELLKIGGAPLPESEINNIGSLPDWMQEHARKDRQERDLFGSALG